MNYELEIQHFLRNNPLTALDQYYIKQVRHKKYPNLILFKYDQLESPMNRQIVQECRGIILDEEDNWRVISRGFSKFFNHGEVLAVLIDWKTARIQEKLDGSYTALYHYKNEWHVQTSGTPDASGEVYGQRMTFADLFWRVFREKGYLLPTDDLIGCSFIFELMTKYNQVIVRHKENDLKLIGARSLNLEQETNIDDPLVKPVWKALNWEIVQSFPLKSLKEIEDTFPSMDPFSQEGYVVVDANFNRVKIKSPKYVALHLLKGDSMPLRRLVELVRGGEVGEFSTYFPEWKDTLEKVQQKFEEFISSLEQYYEKIKHISIQKEFAIEAVKCRYSSALFLLRAGKITSIRENINKLPADKLVELLGLKDDIASQELNET